MQAAALFHFVRGYFSREWPFASVPGVVRRGLDDIRKKHGHFRGRDILVRRGFI